MSDIEPKKLKVAELREELKSRGLDAKGNKPQLIKRLEKALANDESGADASEESSVLETSTASQDDSILEEASTSAIDESMPSTTEPRLSASDDIAPPIQMIDDDEQAVSQSESDQQQENLDAESPEADHVSSDPMVEDVAAEEKDEPAQVVDEDAVKKQPEAIIVEDEKPEADAAGDADDVVLVEKPDDSEAEKKEESVDAADKDSKADAEPELVCDDDELPGEFTVTDSIGDVEDDKKDGKDEKDRKDDDRRGSKRRHSDRYSRHRSRSVEPLPEIEDNTEWVQATHLLLDKYNADLNLRISEDGYVANPITVEGFAFMWAGARSNYGVKKGKICYEVKVVDELRVDHLPEEETSRHVVRLGYSLDSCSTQLGEEPYSYGYGGTGKSSVDCNFSDFGKRFGKLDVIGAYLDFDSDPVTISYTKNGDDLGVCFEVDAVHLEDKALFPHILLKNCEVSLNFGQKSEPFYPIKEGYTFINDIPEAERVRGSLPPEKKEDCEMIMMCGLPGAGKTYWASKESKVKPEKKYNILGTNHIIDKMKVMGLPRKRNYTGRWDVLIDKSTKCLNRLFEIAAKKKRSYILDQTNVYPSAQRRKMRPFEGFQRRAVVLVPSDDEFKKRCTQREKEEGKEVPDSAVLEMKANFALPEVGPLFDKVDYVELDKDEAKKIVDDYNKEGKNAIPPMEKRFRGNDRYGRNDNRYGSRNYGGSGGGSYNNRDRSSSGNRYGSRDYRSGGDRRDNKSSNYRSNDRRGSSSYMGYSDRDRQRTSSYDRKDSRDYRSSGSRSSGYSSGSSWNKGSSGSSNWNNNQQSSGNWNNQGGSSWGGQQQGSWGSNQSGWSSNQQNQGSWGGNNSSSMGNQQNQGSWGGYQQQQQGNNWNSGNTGGYGGYSNNSGSYNQGYSSGYQQNYQK